jgi:hypothetical protein
MYLEKLPKEDRIEKRIKSIYETREKNHVAFELTDEFLSSLTYNEWLNAFKEHYNDYTKSDSKCEFYEHIGLKGILIPRDKNRITFEVDREHRDLKFWIHKGDEEARDIVYKFIERLMD